MTTSVVVLATSLIFVSGLVIDGGRRITTYMRASDLAANAARAAAQSADPASLYDASAATQLDPAQAEAAANEFLTDAGYPPASLVTVAGNQVTVEVTLTQSPVILPTGDVSISAEATSTALRGVDNPTGGP